MKSTGKFVVQKHIRRDQAIHWDLMLEVGEILETYRLELPPEKLVKGKCSATKIFDHPLKFLAYEGNVNKGKGRVEIADTGTYELLNEGKHRCELQFDGKILKDKFTLIHIKENDWEFRPPPGSGTKNL